MYVIHNGYKKGSNLRAYMVRFGTGKEDDVHSLNVWGCRDCAIAFYSLQHARYALHEYMARYEKVFGNYFGYKAEDGRPKVVKVVNKRGVK